MAGSCASLGEPDEAHGYSGQMNALRERYTTCVTAEAEKNARNPTGAEDIAVAAHARCWGAWEGYRNATSSSFLQGAQTDAEMQLARDKAHAHLREYEREIRRAVVDRIVERSLRGGKSEP
jgi:hypothetical protein